MTGVLKAKVGAGYEPISYAGDPPGTAEAQHWNSAWGTIAVGTAAGTGNVSVAAPTANVALTNTVTFTAVVGRRYKLSFRISSAYISVGPATACGTALAIVEGTSTIFGDSDQWMWVGGSYSGGYITTHFNGDGASHTVKGICEAVNATNGTTIVFGIKGLVIEDVGPVVGAAVQPSNLQVTAPGNALGVVAVGSLTNLAPQTIPTATWTTYTNPLVFTPAIGRRYRIRAVVRAITLAAGTTATSFMTQIYDGAVQFIPGDRYTLITGSYDMHAPEWTFDGDGVTRSFILKGFAAAVSVVAYTDLGYFYLEDIGPNTYPALPVPATPPAWTPVTFASPWSNLIATNTEPAQYRKIGDIVSLRGIVTTPSSNVPNASTIFTLPAGFRPPYTVNPIGWGVLRPSANQPWKLNILTDGSVQAQFGGSTGYADLTLSNIQFSTTP